MFMYLQKNKKGFTLIELMVVVAIIGILALLGLRLYTTQQDKAKEAIVKANASTVHTIIQSEMADGSAINLESLVAENASLATANLRNPFTGLPMWTSADDNDFVFIDAEGTPAGTEGQIVVQIKTASAATNTATATHVEVQGVGAGGTLIPEVLTARM